KDNKSTIRNNGQLEKQNRSSAPQINPVVKPPQPQAMDSSPSVKQEELFDPRFVGRWQLDFIDNAGTSWHAVTENNSNGNNGPYAITATHEESGTIATQNGFFSCQGPHPSNGTYSVSNNPLIWNNELGRSTWTRVRGGASAPSAVDPAL